MMLEKRLLGVLDLDSCFINDYDSIDQEYLEKFLKILISSTQWPVDFFGVNA